MLTHLAVKDIALAHRVELDFDRGMTVITGETGAGKSILLDALALTLGDRVDSGMVAAEASRAEICATFDISRSDEARAWLAERDLDSDDEVVLRRVIARDGKSRAWINGTPVTARDLKTLGDMLIDIHSQHEHQSLLKRDTHRRLLDDYGDLIDMTGRLALLTDEWRRTLDQLEQHRGHNEEREARAQLLGYQVDELQQLGVGEGEAALLEQEQKRLAQAESILGACREALALSTEGDDDANALHLISTAISRLERIDLDEVRAVVELLDASRIQLQEAASDLARFESSVELDPARLAVVEERLDAIYATARKHRVNPAELPELLTRLTAELDGLGDAEEEIAKLEAQLSKLEEDYARDAGQLSRKRKQAAKGLISRVTEQLAQLGMSGATFDVALTPREDKAPHPHGNEIIEFLISTNPGQPPRALSRIASGGELSRISLAIQVVTADTSNVPTLVFDEVDVGVGGAVAEVVGTLLRALGDKAQIICVTHLPQVASQGHHHFRVTKTTSGKRARTEILPLSRTERVEEIARMLGGTRITDQSMAHANEMFEAGQD